MTLQELQDRLTLYIQAEKKLLEGGQEWEVDGERFRLPDLEQIQKTIRVLRQEIAMLERAQAGGPGIMTGQAVFTGRR